MSDSRSSQVYPNLAYYERLVNCEDEKIDDALLEKIKADIYQPDVALEALLAKRGHEKSLRLLWQRFNSNLRDHYNPNMGLNNAIRFNHPNLVRIYLNPRKDQKIVYSLKNSNESAHLHIAVYFGGNIPLNNLKSRVLSADKRKEMINDFTLFDQFGNLPLHTAIAGGDYEITKFVFLSTKKEIYDLTELPIRALESRNASLVSIFINKLADDFAKAEDTYFAKYESFNEYVKLLFKAAIYNNKNPGDEVVTILNSISDPIQKNKWVGVFRDIALISDYSDIFTAIASNFPPEEHILTSLITNLFLTADNHLSQKVNTSRLVIQCYLPYLQQNPNYLYDILSELLLEVVHENKDAIDDDMKTANHLLSYIPTEIKEPAKKAGNNPLILQFLSIDAKSPFREDDIITHQLFELANNRAGLSEFKSLYDRAKIYFDETKNAATAVTLFCAAHLAFLHKDYTRSRNWFERCLSLVDQSNDGLIVQATHIMVIKALTLLENTKIDFEPFFIRTYKDNLSKLIDTETFNFSLPFEALLFITNIEKKDDSFKLLLDAIDEIDESFSPFKNNEQTEAWHLFYGLRQAAENASSVISSLHIKYNDSGEINPKLRSVLSAKNILAITHIKKNIFDFMAKVEFRLNNCNSYKNMLNELDATVYANSIAVEIAEAQYKQAEDARVKQKEKEDANNIIKKLNSTKIKGVRIAAEKLSDNAMNLDITHSSSAEEKFTTEDKCEHKVAESRNIADEKLANAKLKSERRAAKNKAKNKAKRIAAQAKKKESAEQYTAETIANEEAQRIAAADTIAIAAEAKANEEAARTAATETRAKEEAKIIAIAKQEAERKADEAKEKEDADRVAAEKIAINLQRSKESVNVSDDQPSTASISSTLPIAARAPISKKHHRKSTINTEMKTVYVYVPVPVYIIPMAGINAPVLSPITPMQMQQQILNAQQIRHARPMQNAHQRHPEQQKAQAKQIPHESLSPEDRIYVITDGIGIPRPLAKLYVVFEGRIFLVGGANRDYYWGVKPRDHDHILFGSADELSVHFPNITYVTPPTAAFASFYMGEEKVDISFKPCGSREENLASLLSDAAGRDLTMNTAYREITANGSGIYECAPLKAKEDILNCHFELASMSFGARNFIINPPRYFRSKFLKHKVLDLGRNPTFSEMFENNVNEVNKKPNEFINNCSSNFQKYVRKTIDKEVESYGAAYTYSVLVDERDDRIVAASNIFNKQEMRPFQEEFIRDFLHCIFSSRNLDGELIKVAFQIWHYLSESNTSLSQAQNALLITSKSMSKFSMFAVRYENRLSRQMNAMELQTQKIK